jgi:hypothetical protein
MNSATQTTSESCSLANPTDFCGHRDKQRDLILKIVAENKLDKKEIENLAKERFNLGVKALNKLQASGLIDELLEKYGDKKSSSRRYSRQGAPR